MIDKDQQLMDFGYYFLGPILGRFFKWLDDQQKEKNIDKFYFLAREGYFLKNLYDQLSLKQNAFNLSANSEYLLCSRVFLFKLNLLFPDYREQSLKHPFKGSLIQLLRKRYALSLEEIRQLAQNNPKLTESLNKNIKLPSDQNMILSLLDNCDQGIKQVIEKKYHHYMSYLKSIGFSSATSLSVVDIGFAGTIQRQLQNLCNHNVEGFYFITTGEEQIDLRRSSCFYHNIEFNQNISMLDKSLYLESILTSPVGQLNDIDSNKINHSNLQDSFLYAPNTISQYSFPLLEKIITGAGDYLNDIESIDQLLSVNECSELYSTLVNHSHIFPDIIKPLLEVDDHISGSGIINPFKVL